MKIKKKNMEIIQKENENQFSVHSKHLNYY